MYNEDDLMKPRLPEWVNFGDSQSQQVDATPFVAALKKRMNQPQLKEGAQSMAAGKAAVSGEEGGGMKSL